MTFPAWPGSGLRLWAVRLSSTVGSINRLMTRATVTTYDAAGQVLGPGTLGSIG